MLVNKNRIVIACLALTSVHYTAIARAAEKDSADKLEEVEVYGSRRKDLSEMEEDTQRLLNVAGTADDPLQAIYALPGVTFSSGGDPVIRGSAPQDNAYYIDQVPARYLFHVFGNSILNKNLVHKFELYPAAFPSQFSNATGGVIDVTLREPRDQEFTTTIDWSFIIAGIMLESAVTDNQAFYASYRRSLLDKFYGKKADDEAKKNGIDIGKFPVAKDYQVKYSWYVNDHNSLSFVAAGASDILQVSINEKNDRVARDPDLAGPLGVDQGFDSQGLIWKWGNDDNSQQMHTVVTHTKDFLNEFYGIDQYIDLHVERYRIHSEFTQQLWQAHHLTLGISEEHNRYKIGVNAKIVACSDFDPDCPTVDAALIRFNDLVTINTHNTYIEDEYAISDRHTLTFGAHYVSDDYLHQSRVEPRGRWDFQINDRWSTYVAAGKYSQLPKLDEIVEPAGNRHLKTVKANHYVWGVKQQLNSLWYWQTDLYYKDLSDVVISINDPTDPQFNSRYSNDAKGKAYGVEVLLKRALSERWYGALAVSLGKTERTNLRNGETAPFEYDKPVMINWAANYQLTDAVSLAFKWSFQSGALYTPIVGLVPSATQPDVLEPVYGKYNSERLPDYHRLDIRAEFRRDRNWGHWSAYIDVINAYNRKNISGYEYSPNEHDILSSNPPGFADNIPVKEQTMIEFFPSIGFEVQF